MSTQKVLVLGNLKGLPRSALEIACAENELQCLVEEAPDNAIARVAEASWQAFIVDLTTPGAARFCAEIRSDFGRSRLPLLGISPKVTDLAFTNAFRWGVDDVVGAGRAGALTARLRGCAPRASTPSPAPGGRPKTAVVADADPVRAAVLARVLQGAEYVVTCVADIDALRHCLEAGPGPDDPDDTEQLVVLNAEMHPPRQLLAEIQSARPMLRWLVLCRQRDLAVVRADIEPFEHALALSAHGPPENLLFGLNLLSPDPPASGRAGVRALHGGTVLFRAAGEEDDDSGFTYSVSEHGVFIRTLAPPPGDRVWLELNPPAASRRVRLEGKVAWTKRFGHAGQPHVPPGFGVQILNGLGSDLQIWRDGFGSLDLKAPASASVPPLKYSAQPFKIPMPKSLSLKGLSSTAPAVAPLAAAPEPGAAEPRKSEPPQGTAAVEPERKRRPGPSLFGRSGRGLILTEAKRDIEDADTEVDRPTLPTVPRYRPSAVPQLHRPPAASHRPGALTALARLTHADSVVANAASDGARIPAVEPGPTPATVQAVVADAKTAPCPAEELEQPPAAEVADPGAEVSSWHPGGPAGKTLPTPRNTGPAPTAAEASSDAPMSERSEESSRRLAPPPGDGSAPDPALVDDIPSSASSVALVRERLSSHPTRPAPSNEALGAQTTKPAPADEPPTKIRGLSIIALAGSTAPAEGVAAEAPWAGAGKARGAGAPPKPARGGSAEPARTASELHSPVANADRTSSPPPPNGLEIAPVTPHRFGSTRIGLSPPPVDPPGDAPPAPPPLDATLLSISPPAASDDVLAGDVAIDEERTGEAPLAAFDVVTESTNATPPSEAPVVAPRTSSVAVWVWLGLMVVASTLAWFAYRRSHAPLAATEPQRAPAAQAAAPTASGGLSPDSESNPASDVEATTESAALEPPPVEADHVPDEGEGASTAATAGGSAREEGASLSADAAPGDSELAEGQGWLMVNSPIASKVYVHGLFAGTTNSWLKVHCGPRYVRLGKSPGQWESRGLPAKLACRGATVLALGPAAADPPGADSLDVGRVPEPSPEEPPATATASPPLDSTEQPQAASQPEPEPTLLGSAPDAPPLELK